MSIIIKMMGSKLSAHIFFLFLFFLQNSHLNTLLSFSHNEQEGRMLNYAFPHFFFFSSPVPDCTITSSSPALDGAEGHFNPSPNYFSKNVANSYKSISLYCQSSSKPHSWGYERAEAVTLLFHLHTNCHPRSKHIVNIMDYINLVLFVDFFF